LSELHLKNNSFEPDYFADALKLNVSNSTLSTLHMENVSFNKNCLIAFVDFIQSETCGIQDLELMEIKNISNIEMEIMVTALSQIKHLENLALTHTPIKNEAYEKLILIPQQNMKLVSLNLSNSSLGEDSNFLTALL
jgi:hypothetical protein